MKQSRPFMILLAFLLVCLLILGGCAGLLKDSGDTGSREETAAGPAGNENDPSADTESSETENSEPDSEPSGSSDSTDSASDPAAENPADSTSAPEESDEESTEIPVIAPESFSVKEDTEISFDPSWQYGEFSKINSGTARLYYSHALEPKDITVCINAGHGTQGGSSVKTQCHPDGTPKVTGGSTAAGETHAYAVSTGMDFADGTPEREGTLALALVVKEKLLDAGYNVLMIRETDDVQLDNIARTLMANAYADCHIALHYDSTSSDKGAYFMSVPNVSSYRAMEPVASHWEEHNRLGFSVIEGLRSADIKVMGDGSAETDLTQTSYSTVPSIDLEVGDKVSDRSPETLNALADGITAGLDIFFEQDSSEKANDPAGKAPASEEESSDQSEETSAFSDGEKTGPAE